MTVETTGELGLWGWSENLGTLGAVIGIAALMATGPLALGLGFVAIEFAVATTIIDYNDNPEDAFTIGMDLLGVFPVSGCRVKTFPSSSRQSGLEGQKVRASSGPPTSSKYPIATTPRGSPDSSARTLPI